MSHAFPDGVLSVVADSHDVSRFLDSHLGDLCEIVTTRKGRLVIRPDSGDPVEMVLKVLQKLEHHFGATRNAAGFKVLPSFVRVIQVSMLRTTGQNRHKTLSPLCLLGDGIDYDDVVSILSAMASSGWCSDNISFGSGGALLQKVDRDTHKCAFKCCLAVVQGKKVRQRGENYRSAPFMTCSLFCSPTFSIPPAILRGKHPRVAISLS